MLTQRRAIMVAAIAATVITATIFGINYNPFVSQQASGAVKFQTLKAAMLSVRHAYPDENAGGSFSAIPSQALLQNAKLQQTIQAADDAWKEREQFCSNVNCAINTIHAFELTQEAEINQPELNALVTALPFSYSQQDTESADVITDFHQIFVKYNDQGYVITVRSAWT